MSATIQAVSSLLTCYAIAMLFYYNSNNKYHNAKTKTNFLRILRE